MNKIDKQIEAASNINDAIRTALLAGQNFRFETGTRINKAGKEVKATYVIFDNRYRFEMRNSEGTSNKSPVIVSDNMSGKMNGIYSISTSVLENPICQKRRLTKGSVCEKCFAAATVSRYSDLERNLSSNTKLLNNIILPYAFIPKFQTDIVRFESFGDLASIVQLINYYKIADRNKNVQFTLWTKNDWFVSQVDELGIEKPKNIKIIKSSLMINIPEKNPNAKLINAVFTVYSQKYLNDNGYNEINFVNCGGRNCRGCMNCYGRKIKNPVINEKLK